MPILELVISVISAAARLATGCGLLAPAGSAPRGDMHRQRHTSAPPSGAVAHIAWPGYGVLFFWQLGCMRYLQAHLGRELAGGASLTGSSAGALVCILAACGVDPHAALRRAAELADAAGVGPRPWGLAGVWGGLVRRWLSELLPEDAAPRCNAARVSVAVTRLPFLTSEAVSGFKDKADVIEATMASVHIPLFMDGRPWACCRGVRCIDGSFLYILLGRTAGLMPTSSAATPAAAEAGGGASHRTPAAARAGGHGGGGGPAVILFDPWADLELRRRWSWAMCLELLSPAGAGKLLEAGHDYASRLDAAGGLAALRGGGGGGASRRGEGGTLWAGAGAAGGGGASGTAGRSAGARPKGARDGGKAAAAAAAPPKVVFDITADCTGSGGGGAVCRTVRGGWEE